MGFFGELKRRNVFRVGTLYVVGAWVLLQVAELLFDILELPDVALKWVFGLLVMGAPVALFLAWAYELTPDGLKSDPGPGSQVRPSAPSGRHFDFAIIALLVIAVAYFSVDKFMLQERQPISTASESSEFDRSVAALPFVNHGSDPDSLAFASGIHDDLLTQLAKIANLRVISNTSVREYAGTVKNVRQIGEELSVKHILEGGVQKAGSRIRINVQLIDATTDNHLWAETYDRELSTENIFAIQSEIAREIARTLRVSLSPATSESLAEFPTDNLEAYKDYVGGLLILDEIVPMLHPARFEQGIELLKSAVAKDPQFALAWARLAQNLQFVEGMRMHDLDVGIDSHTALARAQEIDPGLPQIHSVLAAYAASDSRYEEALTELDQAERGLPGNAQIFHTRYWVLLRMGRYDEALANIERALVLDPKNVFLAENYGDELIRTRRYDDARAHFSAALETFDAAWGLKRVRAEVDFQQYGEVLPLVEVWLGPDAPREAPFYEYYLAWLFWLADDMNAAVAHAKEATVGFDGPSSYLTAEELKAWIFRDAGLDAESRAAAELAWQKALQSRDERPDDPLPILALARLRALDGDNAAARGLARESATVAQSNFTDRDQHKYLEFNDDYAQTLCVTGELDSVENLWREILSEENESTLASLLQWWPPCKKLIFDTEHYRRLEAEFGHLSEGVSVTQH
jgi:TolB-like protein/Tfp pilus assembly protein PilF